MTEGTEKINIKIPSHLADWVRYTTKGRPGGLIDELIRREIEVKGKFYRASDTDTMRVTLPTDVCSWIKRATNGRPGGLIAGLIQREMEKRVADRYEAARKQDSTDF